MAFGHFQRLTASWSVKLHAHWPMPSCLCPDASKEITTWAPSANTSVSLDIMWQRTQRESTRSESSQHLLSLSLSPLLLFSCRLLFLSISISVLLELLLAESVPCRICTLPVILLAFKFSIAAAESSICSSHSSIANETKKGGGAG